MKASGSVLSYFRGLGRPVGGKRRASDAGAPRTAAASAFDEIAHAIINEHLAHGRRGLAVGGVSAGSGVSYVSAGVGFALARCGVRTLLVDTDLSTSGLEELFPGDRAGRGLSDLLLDPALALADVVTQHAPNIAILHAGPALEQASDVLDSDRFRAIAEECVRAFDCSIFDTPPANRSSDGRRVASVVGYSLIVARRAHSFTEDVEQLAKSITDDGTTVIGAVLNGV